MSIQATVTLMGNTFFANLSDGQRLERGDFRAMAHALFRAGVAVSDVRFEWGDGRRMLTSGQQVALLGEMGRLERETNRQRKAA